MLPLKSLAQTALLVCLAAVPSALSASSITYTVDQPIGLGGITGTIQTDGATGVLSATDITAWDLTLSDGTNTYVLTASNSGVYIGGSDVTATATDLYFNFSGTGSGGYGDYLLFETVFGAGQHYYCDMADSSESLCYQGATSTPIDLSTAQNSPESGNQIIGVVAASPIPEPSTWLLFLAGITALVLLKARQSAAHATVVVRASGLST